MKKILIILAVLTVLVSGCSTSHSDQLPTLTEKKLYLDTAAVSSLNASGGVAVYFAADRSFAGAEIRVYGATEGNKVRITLYEFTGDIESTLAAQREISSASFESVSAGDTLSIFFRSCPPGKYLLTVECTGVTLSAVSRCSDEFEGNTVTYVGGESIEKYLCASVLFDGEK